MMERQQTHRARCMIFEGCCGRGWRWDPEDDGSGRTVYCDCEAGDELAKREREAAEELAQRKGGK